MLLGWGVALVVGFAAALLYARASAEGARALELERQLEEASVELDAVRDRLEQQKGEHRKRGEELADLRKRLAKAKRSRGAEREQARSEPGRIAELEVALQQRGADLERARSELEGAHTDLARLHAQREREVARAPREEADTRTGELEAELARARDGSETTQRELEAARHELGRWRKRAENLDKVYMVLRGEYELAKDQLRSQQSELERLRALKVALVDPVPETSNE